MNAATRAFSYRDDPAVPAFPDDRDIIVFDGHCVMCSGWANFVLRNDTSARYRLLPAQTPLGRALYVHYGLDPENFQTNILVANGQAWFKSEGSIRMAEGLGYPWRIARVLRLLPLPVRDAMYKWVARHRLRFFGKRETCYLSSARYADRFLG